MVAVAFLVNIDAEKPLRWTEAFTGAEDPNFWATFSDQLVPVRSTSKAAAGLAQGVSQDQTDTYLKRTWYTTFSSLPPGCPGELVSMFTKMLRSNELLVERVLPKIGITLDQFVPTIRPEFDTPRWTESTVG